MKRLPWSKFKIYGLVAFILAASFLLTLRLKSIFGQDIIIFSIYSPQQLDSLRAALGDERSVEALNERLAFGSIWHVGSSDEGSGFKHIFYFAGKKRSMARVEGLAVTTVLDVSGVYRVSTIEEEFARQDLGKPPEIRDAQGLEVLRAALEDEGVRNQILISLRDQNLDFHSIHVHTIEAASRFDLSLSAPLPNEETFELKWQVVKESAGPYVFLND